MIDYIKKDDRSRLEKLLFCYSSADKNSSDSMTDILNRFAPSSFERSPSLIKLIIIIFFPYSIPCAFPFSIPSANPYIFASFFSFSTVAKSPK